MSSVREDSRLIPVGKITRPHGVRGAVKVYPYGESMSVLDNGAELILKSGSDRAGRVVTLAGVQAAGRLRVVHLREIVSMEDAQAAVGSELCLPEDRLPPTGEGEYYHYRLIGLTVVTVAGAEVGILRGIIETGGGDVYVVDRAGKEVLVPAVDEIVREVDLDGSRMVIDPPEGLIDDL